MSVAKEGGVDKTPVYHWSISGYPMPEDTPHSAYDGSIPTQVSGELLDQVAQSVNREFQTIRRYSRMMELAPTPALHALVRDIRRDEKKHFHRFSSIYSAWTGGQQVPLHKNRVPATFADGVTESIAAEEDDAHFYRTVADSTNIPYIQRSFLDASYDERRHVNWFRYMLNLGPSSGTA